MSWETYEFVPCFGEGRWKNCIGIWHIRKWYTMGWKCLCVWGEKRRIESTISSCLQLINSSILTRSGNEICARRTRWGDDTHYTRSTSFLRRLNAAEHSYSPYRMLVRNRLPHRIHQDHIHRVPFFFSLSLNFPSVEMNLPSLSLLFFSPSSTSRWNPYE